jgi:signal transduction histidine kinase
LELDRKPTELNRLLEELVDFFTPQAQVQRIQLRLRKSEQPVTAQVDPRLIKQAVLNLMLNACQAMPGGGELMLSVARNGSSDALIDVVDTGPGVPPEVAERIFTAYYSTKKGGTGLGLPMSKRIAQEHGGDLSVRSEPGKGSDFTLRLPLT